MVQAINTKKIDLNSFVDNNGANLLHYAVKTGDSSLVSFLKTFIDTNRVDNKGNSPFAYAVINNMKGTSLLFFP